MTKILAINGSYLEGGITDQAVDLLAEALEAFGAEVEVVCLREYPLEFCNNCRVCTQEPGEAPGKCTQHDPMEALIERIEEADAYILASPTNFGSVTAVFKRFMERLVVYAYWPWQMNAPRYRKENAVKKKAVLISSSAAPAILARFFFSTHKQLKMTAKVIGARKVGTLFTGLIASTPNRELPERSKRKIGALAKSLM